MKKTIIISAFIFFGGVLRATCPVLTIEAIDRAEVSQLYKEIAYYTYLHKKKREYIAQSYTLLSEIRHEESKSLSALTSSLVSLSSTPILQAGTIESDILAVSNKMNLALLNSILYQGIKKEIDEQFNISK